MYFINYSILFLSLIAIVSLKGENASDSVLPFQTSDSLKGILALIIIFHHLSQKIVEPSILTLFQNMGYLAVAVFFFVSGYGLTSQYIVHGEGYLTKFLQKRVMKILIPTITASIIYFLYYCWNSGLSYAIQISKEAILSTNSIIINGWYLVTILYFYILFWGCFYIFKEDREQIIFTFFGTICYILFCYKAGYGVWRYNSCLAFWIGIVFKKQEKKIQIMNRFPILTMSVLFFAFACSQKVCGMLETNLGNIGGSLITSALFAILMVFIVSWKKVQSTIFDFLGKVSFELYIVHGLFIGFYRSNIVFVENDAIYFILVLLSAVLFAYILCGFDKKLYSLACSRKRRY